MSSPNEVLGREEIAAENPAPNAKTSTLHLIIAAHSGAGGGISRSVKKDGENIRELFEKNIPPNRLNIIEVPQDKFKGEELLGCISKDVKSQPEDVIVFYYSGHGAYDKDSREPFFDMGTGKDEQLYRVKVSDEIKKKKPRLTVLLTDCCNIKSKFTADKNEPEKGEVFGIKKVTAVSPLFEQLFFHEGILGAGVVDITSSVKGEFSFCFQNQAGSLFTDALVKLFEKNRNDGNANWNWKRMAAELSAEVKEKFNENSEFYTKEAKFAFNSLGLDWEQTTQTVAVPSPLPGEEIEEGKEINPARFKDAVRFGVRAVVNPGKEGGMKITEVIKGTPAEREGVEAGDIFLEINGKPVNSEREYDKAVDDSPQAMDIILINVKDDRKYKATIKLGW